MIVPYNIPVTIPQGSSVLSALEQKDGLSWKGKKLNGHSSNSINFFFSFYHLEFKSASVKIAGV